MLRELVTRIKAGGEITYEEAKECSSLEGTKLFELLYWAGDLTRYYHGQKVDLCAIINAKSGRCSEDCQYCAQSAHYQTSAESYPLLSAEQVLVHAKEMEAAGVKRYALVTSGRGLGDRDFAQTLEIYDLLRRHTNLSLCASFGIISLDKLRQLKEVGVTRYHHNLETNQSYFGKICTTHTYDERIATIKNAQQVGLQVCSGGIISLGETWDDRLELAFTLKALQVDSVPINILHPIKGTPLESQPVMSPLDILKTIAIFRLIMPQTSLRICGGRENALRDLQALVLTAGIDAVLVGNYLTTKGRTIAIDIQMIYDLGLNV
ncbi:MAG: biotin synthase BioB [Firmicutes bacterium]|nr:biotin synthase BioB [Bacillota bacterium]